MVIMMMHIYLYSRGQARHTRFYTHTRTYLTFQSGEVKSSGLLIVVYFIFLLYIYRIEESFSFSLTL